MASATPDSPPVTAPPAAEAAWAALTSTVTLSWVSGLLSLLVASGVVIPQGASTGELLERYPYAVARSIQSLGLSDLWASWLLWLLVLTASLCAVGVALRHRWADVSEAGKAQSLELPETLDRVQLHIRDRLGGREGIRVEDAIHFRVGLGREALALMVVGILAIGASAAAGRVLGYDARLEILPGASGEEALLRSTRWDGRTWVEARPTVALTCEIADPQDPRRLRTCVAQLGDRAVPLGLEVGTEARVGHLGLRTLRERPAEGTGEPQLLVTFPGERAKRLRAEHGKSYMLEDGSRITTWRGGTGPVAVVRPGDGGSAELHVPSVDRGSGSSLALAGVPRVTVEVAIEHAPEQLLLWCGIFFVLCGLGLYGAVPELRVVARSTDTGTTVTARSWNRAQLPDSLLGQLGDPLPEAPTEGAP